MICCCFEYGVLFQYGIMFDLSMWFIVELEREIDFIFLMFEIMLLFYFILLILLFGMFYFESCFE